MYRWKNYMTMKGDFESIVLQEFWWLNAVNCGCCSNVVLLLLIFSLSVMVALVAVFQVYFWLWKVLHWLWKQLPRRSNVHYWLCTYFLLLGCLVVRSIKRGVLQLRRLLLASWIHICHTFAFSKSIMERLEKGVK